MESILTLYASMLLTRVRTLRHEDGQGLTEYALILALIAVVAIVALKFLGGKVTTVLTTIASSI